ERIRITVAFPVEGNSTQQRVIHCLLVEIGVFCVVIRKVQLVLEEDKPAARTSLAVCFIAKRVVRSETFRSLAASNSAGQVVLLVDHVVPKRNDGALVIRVVRLSGNVGHTRIEVRSAHSMADSLILLSRRQ